MSARTTLTVDQVKQRIIPILVRYGVRRAGIFGSLARGQSHGRSDVDLLVDFVKPIGLFRFVGLKLELEQALGRKVDLVEYDAIRPLLGERILNEQMRIL